MNANPPPPRAWQSLAVILVLAATASAAEARMGTVGMNSPSFGQTSQTTTLGGRPPGYGYGPHTPPPYAPPARQHGSSEPSGGGGTGGFTPGGGSGTTPKKKPNLQ
jgi:hypothetical protein